MKRISIAVALFALTIAAAAQQPADDSQKVVATINGEVITKAKLDMLYSNMSSTMRAQYDKAGGKLAFLDNYVAKRLLLQEATKTGYEQRPDVKAAIDAARESALFDRYVRDVVGGEIVTDAQMRQYYDEHLHDYDVPETAKIYHIVISWNGRTREEARQAIEHVASELKKTTPIIRPRFSDAARQYSDDGTSQSGGDLGWAAKGTLDAKFEEAAFSLPLRTMSGIVESAYGYHLIWVDERRPSGHKPFEQVRPDIRDRLVAQHQAEIMVNVKKMTNELRSNSKVSIYRDNVE